MNELDHNTLSGIKCRVITCIQSTGIHEGKSIDNKFHSYTVDFLKLDAH